MSAAAAKRESDLSGQIEDFVALLKRGGKRPRSEDVARQTVGLLRRIVANGRWDNAGERGAEAAREPSPHARAQTLSPQSCSPPVSSLNRETKPRFYFGWLLSPQVAATMAGLA